MSKRTLLMVVSIVASLAMVATGTLAYLSDSDMDTNVMVLGNVDIVQNEQERTEDGELDEFTQNKPLYPAVFEGNYIPWADPSDWVVENDQAWKVVEDNENVVDKFVTVTNTGKSDAYIRTIIAYEGDETYGPEGAYIHVVHNTANVDPDIAIELIGTVTIDEIDYTVYSYTYPEALAAGETSIPSLKQLYMNKAADNTVMEQYGDTYDVLVLSQAVQTNGFEDPAIALDTAFGEVNKENVQDWFAKTEAGSPGEEWPNNNPPVIPEGATVVSTSEDLEAALNAKDEEIYLEPGVYDLGDFNAAPGTHIFGMGDVTFEGTLKGTLNDVTIENITIEGGNSMRWAYSAGNTTFKNCVLNASSVYAVHYDGMAGNVTFEDCEIIGWTAMAGGDGHVTFDGCTIKDNGYYGLVRSYGDVDFIDCTFDVDGANTSDSFPEGLQAINCTFNLTNCTNVNGALEDLFSTGYGGVYNVQ